MSGVCQAVAWRRTGLKAIKLLGKWCHFQSKKVRNGQHAGVGSQAAAEMAELQVERGMQSDSTADAVLLWGLDVAGVYTDNDEWCNAEGGDSVSPLNKFLTSMKPGKMKTNLAFEVQMFRHHNLSLIFAPPMLVHASMHAGLN